MSDGIQGDEPVTKVNIGRLTNAIFAFTLLLLFKNIKTPSFNDYVQNATSEQFGLMQFSEIVGFVNAFIIISLIWMVTFHIFHQMRKVDRHYIYLHFFLLMMVIFIPINSHLYEIFNGDSPFSFFFHLNMLIIGILLMREWQYASRHPGLLQEVKPERAGNVSRKMYYIPATACIGILLSVYGLSSTRDLYYLTIIAFLIDSWIIERKDFSILPGRGRP
ncbi:MAG: DUF1211 domain-containing protein [Methanospirillum sp.]|uniref:TMEM175 family protein n=1 Tax=Methanospirillum sp. TaxID=45200 RepID=UPI00236D02E8|nr:TMEM175 family protein [Methanospirillum sp.]MDD1729388.1 DUF1211 domain-containing protein [Methanospirillum sp.]